MSDDRALELVNLLPDNRNNDDPYTREFAEGLESAAHGWTLKYAKLWNEQPENLWCLAQPALFYAITKIKPDGLTHGRQVFAWIRTAFHRRVRRMLFEGAEPGERGRQYPREQNLTKAQRAAKKSLHKRHAELLADLTNRGYSQQMIQAELDSLKRTEKFEAPITYSGQPREVSRRPVQELVERYRDYTDEFFNHDDTTVKRQARCDYDPAYKEIGHVADYRPADKRPGDDYDGTADPAQLVGIVEILFEGDPDQAAIMQLARALPRHLKASKEPKPKPEVLPKPEPEVLPKPEVLLEAEPEAERRLCDVFNVSGIVHDLGLTGSKGRREVERLGAKLLNGHKTTTRGRIAAALDLPVVVPVAKLFSPNSADGVKKLENLFHKLLEGPKAPTGASGPQAA